MPAAQELLLRGLRELDQRKLEGWRVYTPQPHQELALRSRARRLLIFGGNQCTALDTPVWTDKGLKKAVDVEIGDLVRGGRVVRRWVSPEPEPTWTLHFEGGLRLVCNAHHPLSSESGIGCHAWIRAANLKIGDPVELCLDGYPWGEGAPLSTHDAYALGLLWGDGCLTHRSGVISFTSEDDELHHFLEDWHPGWGEDSKVIERRLCSKALKEKIEHLWGGAIETARHKRIPKAVFLNRDAALAFVSGYTDTDGCVYCPPGRPKDRRVVWASASEHMLRDLQQLLLALGVFAALQYKRKKLGGKTFDQWHLVAKNGWADRLMEIAPPRLARKRMWESHGTPPDFKQVRLKRRTYSHKKHIVGLTVDPTNTYCTAGLLSHNSGKTLNAAVRGANRLLGVNGWEQPRAMLCVSLDLTLMSSNIYEKLFEPGAFDICKQCYQVRHVCEDNGICSIDGSTFRDRAIPAEPLIPQRLLDRRKAKDGFAWYDRARNQPAMCWIKSRHGGPPVTVTFRSTDQGRSKFQGPQWDDVWADEEASNDTSVMFEIERGLIKRQGLFWISATPLAASVTIFRWHQKAEAERAERATLASEGKPVPAHPYHEEVRLPTVKNRALDEDDIERFSEEMSADEKATRLEGEFVILQGLVYGKEFTDAHLVEPFAIPQDWTIYTIEDPGTANAYAVLFIAVDPDGDYWLYDEIYMVRSNIPDLVTLKKEKLSHRNWKNAGFARKPQRMYADPAINTPHQGKTKTRPLKRLVVEEHKRKGLHAWEGGAGVYTAKSEVVTGIFAVKGMFESRRNGEPIIHVFEDLHYFRKEIGLYRWPPRDDVKDVKEKAGPIKKDDHLMDTLRYGVMARLTYVSPDSRPGAHVPPGLAERYKQKKRALRKKRQNARSEQMSMS